MPEMLEWNLQLFSNETADNGTSKSLLEKTSY